MNKQTFEIIDGVYVGPEVWEGLLDLREYKDTLTSLGCLTKVGGWLRLYGCTRLVSLGSLKEVERWANFGDCTSLTSLGSLRGIGYRFDLNGCTNLTSLGSLEEVGDWLDLKDCTSLTSLGSLKKVKGWLRLRGCISLRSLSSLKEVGSYVFSSAWCNKIRIQDLQEKVLYYSSLPLHEALNTLHTEEVQNMHLYRNILLQKLQGG